jgi:hypothetical protein
LEQPNELERVSLGINYILKRYMEKMEKTLLVLEKMKLVVPLTAMQKAALLLPLLALACKLRIVEVAH